MNDIVMKLASKISEDFKNRNYNEDQPFMKTVKNKHLAYSKNMYFDLENCISSYLEPFGILKSDSNLIGKLARIKKSEKILVEFGFKNVVIDGTDISFEDFSIDMEGEIGIIIAENFGRLVLKTKFGFYGWIKKENVEILNVLNNEIEIDSRKGEFMHVLH